MPWMGVKEAEDAIHAGMDMSKIIPFEGTEAVAAVEPDKDGKGGKPGVAKVVGRKEWEESIAWHPLTDPWSKDLNPITEPDPPTVSEQCMMDCRERERTRKRECAEIRKRVQAKLKDLGCPSTVKSTDKTTVCGQKKSKKEKEVTAKKKKSKPKGGK